MIMLHSTQEYDISGIYVAVEMLFVYPVSACIAERSFRSMKRLKIPLQTTMTNDCLSSLAILHIHEEKNQCRECVRPVCTAQRKTPCSPCSLLINDNCTQYKTKNAARRMLEDPQDFACIHTTISSKK